MRTVKSGATAMSSTVNVRLSGESIAWGERLRGTVPLAFESMVRPDEVQSFSVRLNRISDGQVTDSFTVCESAFPVDGLSLTTGEFPDGAYDLEISLVTRAQLSTQHSVRVIFDNWEIVEDTILPPLSSGWFGDVDRLLAVDRSEGWEYTAQDPSAFFGDAQRIRLAQGVNEGYLTWSLPDVKEYTFILYARRSDVGDIVRIACSQDGVSWADLPYTVNCEGPSSGGWLVDSKAVPAGNELVRLSLRGGLATMRQWVGHVQLKALKN